MTDIVLYCILATAVCLILAAVLFIQRKGTKEKEDGVQERPYVRENEGGVVQNRAAGNRNNARARMRARVRQDEDTDDELAEIGEDIALPDTKVGRKKMEKLRAKAERKAAREAEEQERQEKKDREEKEIEQRRKQEGLEAEEEARLEEEERQIQLEKEKKTQEEYERMKVEFAVEEEGFDETQGDFKEKDLYKEFINHIKREKVVILEDLASTFKLKTQAVINRINDMQKDGSLTGVIDDRGKFIYINRNELEDVAKFIKQRGRISLADLSESSNSLISLTPETAVAS